MDPYVWLVDRRVVRRNLERGVITQQQYEQYLKKLKGLAEKDYETILWKDLSANKKENKPKAESDQEIGSEVDAETI